MSNLISLSLNSVDSSSDPGTNRENLIHNATESTTSKKNYTFKEKFISTFLNIKPRKKKRKISDNKIIEDEFINKNKDDNKGTKSELPYNYKITINIKNIFHSEF